MESRIEVEFSLFATSYMGAGGPLTPRCRGDVPLELVPQELAFAIQGGIGTRSFSCRDCYRYQIRCEPGIGAKVNSKRLSAGFGRARNIKAARRYPEHPSMKARRASGRTS